MVALEGGETPIKICKRCCALSLRAFLLEIGLQLSLLWCIPIVKAVLKNNGLSPVEALSDF